MNLMMNMASNKPVNNGGISVMKSGQSVAKLGYKVCHNQSQSTTRGSASRSAMQWKSLSGSERNFSKNKYRWKESEISAKLGISCKLVAPVGSKIECSEF